MSRHEGAMPEGQLHVRGRPVSDTWIVRWACEEVAALLCWQSPLAAREMRRSPARRRLWLRPKVGGRGDHRRPAVMDRVDDLARVDATQGRSSGSGSRPADLKEKFDLGAMAGAAARRS